MILDTQGTATSHRNRQIVRDWGQPTPDTELVTSTTANLPCRGGRGGAARRGVPTREPSGRCPHTAAPREVVPPHGSPGAAQELPRSPSPLGPTGPAGPAHRAGPAPSRAGRPRSERSDWLLLSGAGPGSLKRPARSPARVAVVLPGRPHALHQVRAPRLRSLKPLLPFAFPACLLLAFSGSSRVRERSCSWGKRGSRGLAPAAPQGGPSAGPSCAACPGSGGPAWLCRGGGGLWR